MSKSWDFIGQLKENGEEVITSIEGEVSQGDSSGVEIVKDGSIARLKIIIPSSSGGGSIIMSEEDFQVLPEESIIPGYIYYITTSPSTLWNTYYRGEEA